MTTARRSLICTELSPQELRHASFEAETQRLAKRMQAIANAMDGMTREEAARLADMSDQAHVDAIKRYNAAGIAGMKEKPRSGRPSKLSQKQQRELCEIAVKGPDIEAEGLSAYTRVDVATIAKTKWNLAAHVTTIGRCLRAGGLSRQKARPSHPKKKPEAVDAFLRGPGRSAGTC